MSSVTNVTPASRRDDAARRCAEETQRFFHPKPSDPPFDPHFCFELFRLALGEGDQIAWDLLFQQYRPLVVGWVSRHPDIQRSGGEIQDYVNRAFERMWAALSPAKFERFRGLSALLAYLKMCAHSAIMEDLRRRGPADRIVALDDEPTSLKVARAVGIDSPTERTLLAREARDRLWHAVNERLQDSREQLVVYCLFELGLKPKAILARHPEVFRDVREIYLTRQVVLERLSRDRVLQQLAAEDA